MKPSMGTFRFIKIGFLVPFTFFLVLEFDAASLKNEASLDAGEHGSQSRRIGSHCSRKCSNGRDACVKPEQTSCGGHVKNKQNVTSGSSGAPHPPSSSQPSPFSPAPIPEYGQPTTASTEQKESGVKPMVYILTSIPAGLLVLGLVFILVFWHKKSRAVKPLKAGSNGQLQTSSVGIKLLKRSELESACESFSNIVGSVSDGPLYKGTLSSGIEISVSSIKLDKDLEAQFWKKISILSKVNHKNFVNLLGYCEEPLTRMFVFEYAPNGTLFEHLHFRESLCLGWAARLRIAMGVAYCLDYMYQLNPPVILKNLDTSVIYLTDDYAAKIADFELWSGTAEGGTVVGSPMALLQEVPDKSSIVQKFGVVLLELLSGRDPSYEHSGPAEIWAWDLLKVDIPLKDMMDPELKSFPEDRAAAVFQLIKQCLNPDPEQVLSMKEVTARLKEITGISPKSVAPLGYELEIVSEGTP